MDKELLIQRIETLCKEKNITLTTAFVNSGVGKNFKSNMRTSNPSMGKITMLANFFNVPIDYLLGKTNTLTNKVADDELNEFLETLRTRSEMKMLFNLTKNATKEEVVEAIKIITDILTKD